jgi:acetyltransferase-like isoleucine patch superfamily enzyme
MRPKTIIENNCIIGHLTVFEGESKVGKGTLIHAQCHITKGVTIGENVFIAPFFVGANDKRMCHARENMKFKVDGYTIDNGARIAIGVTVLPGVTIGSNSMIGAGSLITKDIPDNAIAFGSPARVVGEVSKDEKI